MLYKKSSKKEKYTYISVTEMQKFSLNIKYDTRDKQFHFSNMSTSF